MQPDYFKFAGIFVFMAGFVIGLGSVTVIDFMGFLSRKSSYWTLATVRAHKVTKLLIWIGFCLAIFGYMLFYVNDGFNLFTLSHLILFAALLVNGLFLSMSISPMLNKREEHKRDSEILEKKYQRMIMASFIVSFLGWWGALALFALRLSI